MLHRWERGFNLNRTGKEHVIRELREEFSRAKAIVFTDFRGMTVADLSDLRALLREGKLEYKIVKNTLAKIASEGTTVAAVKDVFKGPVGMAISYDDPVLAVKKVIEYSRKNDKLKIGCGFIEGTVCAPQDLKAVADLPPRHVLLSTMAGGFKSPLNKLGWLLNATLSSFINALEALKNKKSNQ